MAVQPETSDSETEDGGFGEHAVENPEMSSSGLDGGEGEDERSESRVRMGIHCEHFHLSRYNRHYACEDFSPTANSHRIDDGHGGGAGRYP